MSGLLVALPLHLACQLISPENPLQGNISFVEDPLAQNYTTVLPSGYTAFPDVGVAYKYYKNKLTWNAARKQCIAEGASLAIVDSFKKVDYIMSVKDKAVGVHTGIHRLFDTTEWTSIKDGHTLDFIPWKPDVVPNAGTLGCVALWSDGTGVGPWTCTTVLASVCEIPMFKKSHRNEAQIFERSSSLIVHN